MDHEATLNLARSDSTIQLDEEILVGGYRFTLVGIYIDIDVDALSKRC